MSGGRKQGYTGEGSLALAPTFPGGWTDPKLVDLQGTVKCQSTYLTLCLREVIVGIGNILNRSVQG